MWRQAAYMLCLLLTMTGTVARHGENIVQKLEGDKMKLEICGISKISYGKGKKALDCFWAELKPGVYGFLCTMKLSKIDPYEHPHRKSSAG